MPSQLNKAFRKAVDVFGHKRQETGPLQVASKGPETVAVETALQSIAHEASG